MDNPEKLTTLDTNKKHWTKTQNTGHKHKTLDKNKQIEKHKKEN